MSADEYARKPLQLWNLRDHPAFCGETVEAVSIVTVHRGSITLINRLLLRTLHLKPRAAPWPTSNRCFLFSLPRYGWGDNKKHRMDWSQTMMALFCPNVRSTVAIITPWWDRLASKAVWSEPMTKSPNKVKDCHSNTVKGNKEGGEPLLWSCSFPSGPEGTVCEVRKSLKLHGWVLAQNPGVWFD